MERKRFLLSGAAVCLMLTSGLAYAQSPGDTRRDEPKKDRLEKSEPAKAGQSRSESSPEERTREPERRNPSARQTGEEHRPSTSTQQTGSPRQDEQNRARNEGSQQDERNRARTEGSKQNQQDRPRTEGSKQDERNRVRSEGSKQNERADESRRGNREEGNKASSPADKSARDQKSTQESDKLKSGAAPNESSQSQRGEATKASPTQSQSQESATPTNRTGAANETDRSRTPNEAQRGAGDHSQTNTSTSTSDNQGRLSRDKEVRISETMRSRELAAPERNLNISIRVGTEIPDRVRVHRLPPEIVSIEPQYRDYDYFTTEEEIVIVEPRTHRVVSTVPKDASRARAEVRGGPANSDGRAGQTIANGGNRATPCQVMRRDSSGQLSDVSSTTVGSSRDRQNSIVVTVETPDQQSTQPIALDAPAGQIIVATQGQGDCQVIIEPQTNR